MPQNIHVKGRGNFWFPDDMSDREIQEYIDTELRRERQEKLTYGTVPDVLMGAVRGASETVGGGLARLSEKLGAQGFADYIREGVRADEERLFGVGPEMPQNKAAEIGSMLGGTGAYYGVGALTGGLGTAVLGTGSGLEEQRKRQLAAKMGGYDVTGSDSLWSELGGAALGATEALPVGRWVGKLGRLAGPVSKTTVEAADELLKRGGLRGYGAEAVRQGLEEAAQEVGAGVGQNALARLYKDDQELWEGVGEGGVAGGVMGALFGAAGHGYNRRAAAQRAAELDEYRKSQAEPPEDVGVPALSSPQLGLFTGQPEAQPRLRATPASDLSDLYGGDIAEPTEEDPQGLRDLLAPPPRPAEEEPPWEQRKTRLTPELADQAFSNLSQDEARIGDTVLNFESPLDRAAWMGTRHDLGERRKEHLAVVADALGGHTGEAWGLGKRIDDVIGNTLKKAGDNKPGELFVAKMITPGPDAPRFQAIPPYRPPVQAVPGRPAEQMELVPTPGQPEPVDLNRSISNTLSQAAKDMGMGRSVRTNLAADLVQEAGQPYAPAREAAELALGAFDPAQPAERQHLSLWSNMKPGALNWLRANNWINPKEWGWLERTAKQTGHLRSVREANPEMAQADVEALAIRNVMRDRAVGSILPPDLEKVYQRSLGAFQAAGNALRGAGMNTMAEVDARLRPAPEPEAKPPAFTPWQQEQIDYAKKRVAGYKPAQNLFLSMLNVIKTPTGQTAEGRWDSQRKAIELAFLRPEQGEKPQAWQARMQGHVAGVLDHEFVHFLKASDVFEPKQWNALVRAAAKRHLPEAQRLYGDQPNYTPEMIQEEAVANLFRDTANIRPGSFVSQMWQRIMNSFRAAGNGLIGRGWHTADDVMGAMRAGEVAQQTPQADLQAAQIQAAQARQAEMAAAPAATEGMARARSIAGEQQRQQAGAAQGWEQRQALAREQAQAQKQMQAEAAARAAQMQARLASNAPATTEAEARARSQGMYALSREEQFAPDTYEHPFEASTRRPWAVGVIDPPPEILLTGVDSIRGTPMYVKGVEAMKQYRNFRDITDADPDIASEKIIKRIQDNLTWLYDQVPDEIKKRSRLWYDGANKIARNFAKQYGVTNEQAAGIIAVMSPEKDWFQNAEVAKRTINFMRNVAPQVEWTPAMARVFKAIAPDNPRFKPIFKDIKGKRFAEVTDSEERALWFRLYDEAYNTKSYPLISPEGEFGENVRTTDGKKEVSVAWKSLNPIMKGMSIFEDGSFANISDNLGGEHKVRNFYNNILVPNSARGHVTIDTHAVAAALVRALAGESVEVLHNFGRSPAGYSLPRPGSSSHLGESGTYAFFADAYRRAAADQKILPREFQSITWEAVRGLFKPGWKRVKSNVAAIDSIWENVNEGKISREEALGLIRKTAGGIDDPAWHQRGQDAGLHAEEGPAGDAGGLPGAAGLQGLEQVPRAGDRGEPAGSVPAPQPGAAGRRRQVKEPALYALPRRDVHVGLKLGTGSPLNKQYPDPDTVIPFDVADKIYDALADKLGVKIKKRHHSQGYWEKATEPSTHLTVTGKRADIEDYLHALSYALNQTMTISARPQKGGKAYVIDLVQQNGREMADGDFAMQMADQIREIATTDPDFTREDGSNLFEVPAAWGGMKSLVGGASAIDKGGRPSLRLYNDDGHWSPEQIAGMERILRDKLKTDANLDFKLQHGEAEFLSAYNDWETQPNGETFKDRILRRDGGVLQSYIDDHLRPIVDRAMDKGSRAGRESGEAEARSRAARARAEEPAVPEEVKYSLPRAPRPPPAQQKPRRISDQILDLAGSIRKGVPVNPAEHDPADLAVARQFAANQKLDLDLMGRIDPDEHLTIEKMDMDQRSKEHMRNAVRIATMALDRHPKVPLPFDVIRKKAAALAGGDELLDIPKLKESETLKPEVRLGYGIVAKGLETDIVRRYQELSTGAREKSLTPAQQTHAQKEIDALEHNLQQIHNVLIPARTQDGRNLVYHRIMAQGDFGREYWHSKAKRFLGIPPDGNLPADVARPLNEVLNEGTIAQNEFNEAKARVRQAEEMGDAPAQEKARRNLKEKEQGVMNSRKKLAREMATHQKTTRPEALLALWKAGLLTNPAARFADMTSNLAFSAAERLASVPASWVDAALDKGLAGKQEAGKRTVLQQRLNPFSRKSWHGMGEGWKAAGQKWQEIKSGTVSPEQMEKDKTELYKEFNIGEGMLAKGARRYVESVQGFQAMSDLPFRKMARQQALEEMAELQAINEQKAGNLPAGMTIDQRARQLISNPTDDMKVEANAIEEFAAFAEDNWGSEGFRALKGGMGKMPEGKKLSYLADFVFPFVKVPTNVFRRVFEYSPVGLARGASGIAAARFSQKVMDPKTRRLYAQLIGRGSVGSGLMLLGFAAAKAGLMNGIRDDDDVEGKLADEAANRPPGSFRIPGSDRWHQIGRISPGGNLMVAGATTFQKMKDEGNIGSLAAAAGGTMAKSILDMPFMMGFQMLSDALESPGKKMETYAKRQLGSVVPAGLARIAATVDPVLRDTRDEGFASDLLSRLPGISYALPERKDFLGRSMPQPGLTPLGPLLDPFRTRTEYTDPVSQAIGRDTPEIGKLRKGADEEQSTYRKRAELAGELYYRGILEALQSSDYTEATTVQERRDVLEAGKRSGSQALRDLMDDTYKEAPEPEKRKLLDEYLADLKSYAAQ